MVIGQLTKSSDVILQIQNPSDIKNIGASMSEHVILFQTETWQVASAIRKPK